MTITSPARLRGARAFPHRYQNSINDCATACVLAIGEYFGVTLDLRDIRDRLSADPTSGVRVGAFEDLQGLFEIAVGKMDPSQVPVEQFPFVAYLGVERHFVTVWKQDRRGAFLVGDPGIGLHTVGAEDFRARWEGIAIVLRPLANNVVTVRKPRPSSLRLAWGLFSDETGSVAGFSAIAFLRGVTGVGFSVLLPRFLSDMHGLALLAFSFFGVSALLTFASAASTALLKKKFATEAGLRILNKMPTVDKRYYTVGDIFTRFQDVQSVVDAIVSYLRDIPYVIALLLGTAVYLVLLDAGLAVCLGLGTAFILLAFDPCIQMARSFTFKLRILSAKLNNQVRQFWTDEEAANIRSTWKELIQNTFIQTMWTAPVGTVISQLLPLSIGAFAAWEVYVGGNTSAAPATLLTILTIISYFVSGIASVYGAYVQWQTVEPAMFRIDEFLTQ